jgi:transposase
MRSFSKRRPPSLIGAQIRAFEAIGGVPGLLVPDNAKIAVIKGYLYDPPINHTDVS